MGRYRFPTSDADLLKMMSKFCTQAQIDKEAGQAIVQTKTMMQMKNIREQFIEVQMQLKEAREAYYLQLDAANMALKKLHMEISMLWDRLQFEQRWEKKRFNLSIFPYYGLTNKGLRPRIDSRQAWFDLAQTIIEGHKKAKVAGHDVVDSVKAVRVAREKAMQAVETLSSVKRTMTDARAALITQRDETRPIIQAVVAEMRLNLRPKSDTAQRNVMRSYGIEFMGDRPQRKKAAQDPDAENANSSNNVSVVQAEEKVEETMHEMIEEAIDEMVDEVMEVMTQNAEHESLDEAIAELDAVSEPSNVGRVLQPTVPEVNEPLKNGHLTNGAA